MECRLCVLLTLEPFDGLIAKTGDDTQAPISTAQPPNLCNNIKKEADLNGLSLQVTGGYLKYSLVKQPYE